LPGVNTSHFAGHFTHQVYFLVGRNRAGGQQLPVGDNGFYRVRIHGHPLYGGRCFAAFFSGALGRPLWVEGRQRDKHGDRAANNK
jgi:hypothetical protein